MINIGLHNGYWVGSEISTLQQALSIAAEVGLDVYEMETWDLYGKNQDELLEIRRMARDYGIHLICNGGFSDFNDIASDDLSCRRKGSAMAVEVIQAMQTAGINSWSGINYSAWLRRPSVRPFTKDEKCRVKDLSVRSLKEICHVAQECGVSYCFEIVNRFEQFLVNTAKEGVNLIREVDNPSAKLLLDTFHMNIEEDSIADAIQLAIDEAVLGEVHVGESNRRIPGSGITHMDWQGIFDTLRIGKFSGPIVMEPVVRMGTELASDVCLWRDLHTNLSLTSLKEDVKQGIEYIRSFF